MTSTAPHRDEPAGQAEGPRSRLGRKRDNSRDAVILEAALDVLAEVGYPSMTMDAVALRARAGKATLYRRWPSKEDLVLDAVARMGQQAVDLAALPDTGTLRGDILALFRPKSLEAEERKMRVIAGLSSMVTAHPALAESAAQANIGAWFVANQALIQRAVDRGEVRADADVPVLATVLPAMSAARSALEGLPINREFLVVLLDEVLLPAMRP